jgi:hypothetical protein
MLHEGIPMNYRKALFDYPIKAYLKKITPPLVVFLNLTKIKTNWAAYKPAALNIIKEALQDQLAPPGARRIKLLLNHIPELFPSSVRKKWDQIVQEFQRTRPQSGPRPHEQPGQAPCF